MKICFSTVGCPDWSWDEIFAVAKDLNYNGIEVRGIGCELFAPNANPFLLEHIESTKARLSLGGLSIPVLSTNSIIGAGDTDSSITEAKKYIDLAQKLCTPYIRVLISPNPSVDDADIELGKKNMRILCEYAYDKNVDVLIETNGLLADSAKMRDFMEDMPQNAGILWDIHHPYRFFGESVEQTYQNIGKYIRHVHVKDSVLKDGVNTYRMIGYGDLPIFDALKLLSDGGYDGFISLEWVKRWNPDLQEPGIVFAHFANYITCLMTQI